MKILITGANGYLGSRFCQYFRDQGFWIVALCRNKIPYTVGWTDKINELIIGELNSRETIEKILEARPDIIIHLISLNRKKSEEDIKKTLDTNVKITWSLLDKYVKVGVKKFLNFSSIHAEDGTCFGESSNSRYPKNLYGLTHLLRENICNYYNQNYESDILNIRLTNSYGEPVFNSSNGWDLIINQLVKQVFEKNKVVLKSNGSAIKNFINYRDVCLLTHSLILNDKKNTNYPIYFKSNINYSLIEIVIIIQNIFYNRYKHKIPIYINENELLDQYESKAFSFKTKIKQKSYGEEKQSFLPIHEGINSLFDYFENYKNS